MKKNILLLGFILLLSATGCISSKSYRGLIPEKDARVRGVTIATPWGSIKIDEIDTRVNPGGTNPLSPIPLP